MNQIPRAFRRHFPAPNDSPLSPGANVRRGPRRFVGGISRIAAPVRLATALLLAAALGCSNSEEGLIQGYVEGEYVFVASAQPGELTALSVARGDEVKAGAPLFMLDDAPQRAARDEAARRLASARSTLADLQKGKRPSEIASLESELTQARESLAFSEVEFARQTKLAQTQAGSVEELQRARAKRNEDEALVRRAEADLATARLPARDDQIAAAEENVRALEAALARAEWDLSQMRQAAPAAGQIVDTLYRQGEWVAAGKPVVQLLPPENVRVRLFVPEPQIGAVHYDDEVRVTVDGRPQPLVGRVSFISPRAEFTPPVIFSRQSRAKLVFMVEARFPPEVAATLHPGQPVDCRLGPGP